MHNQSITMANKSGQHASTYDYGSPRRPSVPSRLPNELTTPVKPPLSFKLEGESLPYPSVEAAHARAKTAMSVMSQGDEDPNNRQKNLERALEQVWVHLQRVDGMDSPKSSPGNTDKLGCEKAIQSDLSSTMEGSQS